MPPTTRRRTLAAGALAIAALLAAGCGGDEPAATGADGPTGTGAQGTSPTSDPAGEPASDVAARPSAGCGTSAAGATVEQEHTLTVADTPRRYLLTVPSAHDGEQPLPVVFDFHGLMEGAEVHAQMSQYSALAEQEGFVAVFPHGTGEPVRWNPAPDAAANTDIAYFDAVLDEVGASTCLDLSRVYATGLSNGAMFTSALLCERADVLAAAAPVAGITDNAACDPSRPVPILAYHGTADPILLFNGGVNLNMIPGMDDGSGTTTTTAAPDLDGEGYPANLAAFAARNGCGTEPTDTEVTPEVVHRVYDCPEGADVEMYIILGGGHSWPSSEFSQGIGDIVGPTTFDVDATADSWAFLRQFQAP